MHLAYCTGWYTIRLERIQCAYCKSPVCLHMWGQTCTTILGFTSKCWLKSTMIQLCSVSTSFSATRHISSHPLLYTHMYIVVQCVYCVVRMYKSRTFFPFLSAAFPFPLSSLPPPSGTGVATAGGDTGRAGSDRLWVSLSTCMGGGRAKVTALTVTVTHVSS